MKEKVVELLSLKQILVDNSSYKESVIQELYCRATPIKSKEAICNRLEYDIYKIIVNSIKLEPDDTESTIVIKVKELLADQINIYTADNAFSNLFPTDKIYDTLNNRTLQFLTNVGRRTALLPFYIQDKTNFGKLPKLHPRLSVSGFIEPTNSGDFETCFSNTNPEELTLRQLFDAHKEVKPILWISSKNQLKHFLEKIYTITEYYGFEKYEQAEGLIVVRDDPAFKFSKLKSGSYSLDTGNGKWAVAALDEIFTLF